MARLDPWDSHLESLTATLDAVSSGSRSGPLFVVAPGLWRIELRAARRSVTVLFAADPALPAEALPGDYQLALIYGLQFDPAGEGPEPRGFAKSLTVHEGFRWDEEMLRELLLEALGVLRFILGVGDAAAVTVDDRTRPSAKALVTRKKR